jgi:uncharacterized membrane-anchored protein
MGAVPAGLLLLCLAQSSVVSAQEKPIKWIPGPVTADLRQVAEVKIEDGYVFADAAESRRAMELMGNKPTGLEAGLIMPTKEGDNWIITFDYNPVGYVPDDEKDRIDEVAILESIRAGTETANEFRKEKGFQPLHVTGWFEKPHYDETTNNLVWAIEAKEEGGGKLVNYDVRLLGRGGYMSVTLVTDPASLSRQLPEVAKVLAGFSYKTGNRYAEFVKGDKLAGYGLTALVAGGGAAAAVKLGLFAWLGKVLLKSWKLLVAGLVALAAGVKRALRWFKKEPQGFEAP